MAHLKIIFLLAVAMMAMTVSAQNIADLECNPEVDCKCNEICSAEVGSTMGYCAEVSDAKMKCKCVLCLGKPESAECKEIIIEL